MPKEEQTAAKHSKYVPLYHWWTYGLLLLSLIWALVQLVRLPAAGSVINLGFVAAVILTAFHTRVFAVRVQDRVIRLEERMRLAELLPADLRSRIGELSTRQLVAIRFASDAEVPELVRQVLTEQIRDKASIKKLIRTWRPDYARV
ncbi:MAG: DUF6526 family protein [Gemmatimonadales bacterium]